MLDLIAVTTLLLLFSLSFLYLSGCARLKGKNQ